MGKYSIYKASKRGKRIVRRPPTGSLAAIKGSFASYGSYARSNAYTYRGGIPRSVRVHEFTRCATNNIHLITVGGSQTAGQGGFSNSGIYDMGLSFSLSGVNLYRGGTFWARLNLPNVSELTALYDQYRIDWVEVAIGFNINSANSVDGNNANLPYMWVVKDYDDTNVITTADANQYENVECIRLGTDKPWNTFRVKPRCQTSIKVSNDTSTYTITPYGGKNNPFIDSINTEVEHYGMKMVYYNPIQPVNTTVYGSMILQCKFHITMKNPR